MGVIDELGILEEDEVYANISCDDKKFEEVEGKVIVGKNPCLHPGDIRILKAVSSLNDVKYEVKEEEKKSFLIFLHFIIKSPSNSSKTYWFSQKKENLPSQVKSQVNLPKKKKKKQH